MRFNLAIVAGATLALLSGAQGDQCAVGSSLIKGNWFCQPVDAIRYSNVGKAGSYKQIIKMATDGSCLGTTKHFSGPLSPLDEEVSLHFRGPLKLKQLAAYKPSAPARKQRRVHSPKLANHVNNHQQIHQKLEAKSKRKEQRKRDTVTATINGQVVSWENNWLGDTTAQPTANPQMVTATIDGQVVSWINNWFGPATLSTSPTAIPATTKEPVPEKVENAAPNAFVAAPKSQVQGPALSQDTSGANSAPDTRLQLAAKVGSAGNLAAPADEYERIGYYHASSQTVENLVFLGNHGGQGSGVFDYQFGASLAYANKKGTGGAASPQILADTTLPSDSEVIVMLGEVCTDGGCGYVRPGAVAHHGFDGADKVFLMEFIMPKDGTAGFNADMPAIWMLNAQIPRTLQYGNGDCSCWKTGCGEFDIAETLSSGSMFMKSTLHTNAPGGDSDYLLRPTSGAMKLAVIFDSREASAHIQVLPQSYDFPTSLTAQEIKKLCSDTAASRVSHFHVHS